MLSRHLTVLATWLSCTIGGIPISAQTAPPAAPKREVADTYLARWSKTRTAGWSPRSPRTRSSWTGSSSRTPTPATCSTVCPIGRRSWLGSPSWPMSPRRSRTSLRRKIRGST